METTGATKWKIFDFVITEENQILPIDIKLPKDVKVCKGVILSVKEFMKISYTDNTQLGELSLQFNARKLHPLHLNLHYQKDLTNKKQALKLDCKIEDNQSITGFYMDYGLVPKLMPYTVKLYLECYATDAIHS